MELALRGLGTKGLGPGHDNNPDHSPDGASLSDEPGHGEGGQRREEQQDRQRPWYYDQIVFMYSCIVTQLRVISDLL